MSWEVTVEQYISPGRRASGPWDADLARRVAYPTRGAWGLVEPASGERLQGKARAVGSGRDQRSLDPEVSTVCWLWL